MSLFAEGTVNGYRFFNGLLVLAILLSGPPGCKLVNTPNGSGDPLPDRRAEARVHGYPQTAACSRPARQVGRAGRSVILQ